MEITLHWNVASCLNGSEFNEFMCLQSNSAHKNTKAKIAGFSFSETLLKFGKVGFWGGGVKKQDDSTERKKSRFMTDIVLEN